MLLRRAGLTASAGLSCLFLLYCFILFICVRLTHDLINANYTYLPLLPVYSTSDPVSTWMGYRLRMGKH